MSALGLAFGAHVLLARRMGAEAYGGYAFALSWVSLLAMVAVVGLDRLLVREVSACCARASWGLLGGLLRWAFCTSAAISLLLIASALALRSVLAGRVDNLLPAAFVGVLLLVPLTALLQLLSPTLQGLQRFISSRAPDVLLPAALIALVALGGTLPIPASRAVYFHATASAFALACAAGTLAWALPRSARVSEARYQPRQWLNSALPFFLMSALGTLDVHGSRLLLGMLRDPAELGAYTAAERLASLVSFFLASTSMVLAPTVARLHAAGAHAHLQRLVTRYVRGVVLATLPLALLLLAQAPGVLGLFGAEFGRARVPLSLLVAGEMVNVCAGPVACLLTMTGNERIALRGLGIGAGAHLVLGALLIPRWGMEGAAAAGAAGTAVWNVTLAQGVRRHLGIRATLFGVLRREG